jgi:sugar phosphate isomerase/epimerase
MKLGVNTVLFGPADLETALQHLSWANYQYVELAAIQGMVEHITIGCDVEAVKDLLKKYNLTPTAMEAATTDKERLRGLFKLAKEIGFDLINIGSGGTTGDEESTKQCISLIRELAAMAADSGVRLSVKPHVGSAIYNADTGMRLIEEVPSPALGLNFDPSHLYRANETTQEVAKRWGSRIFTSHFRDCPWRQGGPGSPEQQIPGRGEVNIPATLAALKSVDYTGPVNLEVIGAGNYTLSHQMGVAAETRGYMRRCLQELGL